MPPFEISKVQKVDVYAITSRQIPQRGEIAVGDPNARMLVFVIDGVAQLFDMKALTIPKDFGEALDRAILVHKNLPPVTQATPEGQASPFPGGPDASR